MALLTRVSLLIKVRKLDQAPKVLKCAMVQSELKRTGLDASIVKGYLEFNGSACPHYWVEDTQGASYDVTTHGKPDIFQCIKTVSEETKIIEDPDPENGRLYEMYTKEPKDFWVVYKKATRR
jgi:hypothetical protein